MQTITAERADDLRRVGLLSVHTSPLTQPGTGDSGGMNVYLVSLARRLVEANLEVDIFTRASGANLPATVKAPHGYRVHHVAAGPPGLGKSDLASHLCAFYIGMATHPVVRQLDILHGHYWMSGWVGRRIGRRLGLPLVQSFHTLARAKNERLAPGDLPEPALRLAAEQRVARDADAIVAPSMTEQALLRERYGAARIRLIEPGVDLDVFHPNGHADADQRVLDGGPTLLFVGRLQPLKAPDLAVRLLPALDRLLPRGVRAPRLVIVGGPSGAQRGVADPPALLRLARRLGVADRVAILPPRPQEELAALYQAADVVVVPSYSESFGLVALEAQACGTPVVAADVGGLRHAVAEGGGTLVGDHAPEAFARAIAPYLVDPDVRARAADAGPQWARSHTWSRTAARTLALYRDLHVERVTDRTADIRRHA